MTIVLPRSISEAQIKQHLITRVNAMHLMRPKVEGIMDSTQHLDRKDSFEIPAIVIQDGSRLLTFTKFRQMWGEEGGLIHLKYFAANEIASQVYGIGRIDVWSIIVEPTTGITIGFVSGNLTTDIRTALSGVIGFSRLKEAMEIANDDYTVGVLGFGRIGRSVICALETEKKKPKLVRVASLDQDLPDLIRKMQKEVSFEIRPVKDIAGAIEDSTAVFDCVALNQRAPLVTREMVNKLAIYVDISKQAITLDAARTFRMAAFDSTNLARHLPSIAGEAFGLKDSGDEVTRIVDISSIINGNIECIDGMNVIYTVIGRPAIDAVITHSLFTEITGIHDHDRYLELALQIAESKNDDF